MPCCDHSPQVVELSIFLVKGAAPGGDINRCAFEGNWGAFRRHVTFFVGQSTGIVHERSLLSAGTWSTNFW
jgi:hypothetical protein